MIKNFKKFLESISGWELTQPVGPNYGENSFPPTLSVSDTQAIYSTITDKFYTFDEYDNEYNNYLKNGGDPLNGFSRDNLDLVLTFNSEHNT